MEKELAFHPGRRWRADFAHIPSRTLIEIEGGIWIQGRHNRAEGFLSDIGQYFEAALAGWTVLRVSERQLTLEAVQRLVRFVEAFQSGEATLSVSDLKPALAGLSKVVSGKSSLASLRCVRVDATPESAYFPPFKR